MLFQHTKVLFRSMTDLIVDEIQKKNHRVGKIGLLGKKKKRQNKTPFSE